MDAVIWRKAPKWPEIFSISLLISLFSGNSRANANSNVKTFPDRLNFANVEEAVRRTRRTPISAPGGYP
jgi:hypothetical protein